MKKIILLGFFLLFLSSGRAQTSTTPDDIVIEGEDPLAFDLGHSKYISGAYRGGVITHRLTPLNRNPHILGSVSGNTYQQILPTASSALPIVSYKTMNVPAGTYDIYVVFVPENMDDTTKTVTKHNQFTASLSYTTECDTPAVLSNPQIFKSDTAKVDTILLFQDFKLPISSFDVWHDYPYISLKTLMHNYDRKIVLNNYYIDCFILKNKGGSKCLEKDGIRYEINERRGEASIIGADTLVAPTNPLPDSVYYQGHNYPVTSIGNNAFFNNHCITSLVLPHGLKAIGQYTFYGCSNLTSIMIPKQVKKIGQSAFYGCSGLTSINLPDSITQIEPLTFANCRALTSINIPDNVTRIEKDAFYYCTHLDSMTLSKNIIFASLYGTHIKVIVCLAINPPRFENDFEGFNYTTLYVPYGTSSDYISSEEITLGPTFISIVEMSPTAIHSICSDPTAVQNFYTIGGLRLPQRSHGINIVKFNNGRTKKIVFK
jgi:hypothetical protein